VLSITGVVLGLGLVVGVLFLAEKLEKKLAQPWDVEIGVERLDNECSDDEASNSSATKV